MTNTPRFDHELTFGGDLADRIETGEAILALAPPARIRPPAVGRSVALFRFDQTRPITVRTVVIRARLILTPTGVARVLSSIARPVDPNAALVGAVLAGLEQHNSQSASKARALARLAGFPGETGYADLYDFHKRGEDLAVRRTPRGRIVRDLIGWERG